MTAYLGLTLKVHYVLVKRCLCLLSSPFRSGVKATHFTMFLRTYCSVLKHYVSVLDIDKQADRFTLLPEPLSCAEALSLLLCWASLSRNTALFLQIQSLSQTHKFKELLGKCKYVLFLLFI